MFSTEWCRRLLAQCGRALWAQSVIFGATHHTVGRHHQEQEVTPCGCAPQPCPQPDCVRASPVPACLSSSKLLRVGSLRVIGGLCAIDAIYASYCIHGPSMDPFRGSAGVQTADCVRCSIQRSCGGTSPLGAVPVDLLPADCSNRRTMPVGVPWRPLPNNCQR